MGHQARVAKRKHAPRWTPLRLSELMAELKALQRQVRVAEAVKPKRAQPSMTH